MPRHPRSKVVRKGEPGIFHVTARCVRQYRLLGVDPLTGKDYSHRRVWILDRLRTLVSCFGIDVGFGALMENHVHLILRVVPESIRRLTKQQVALRWLTLFPGKRDLEGTAERPSKEKIEKLVQDKERIKELRKRLMDLSWFMRCFSEYIARRANLEDDRQGRFWDGRFRCRELVGESALLVCGLYVDLNGIRAGAVKVPEESLWTTAGIRMAVMRSCMEEGGWSRENWLSLACDERHRPAAYWLAQRGVSSTDWFAPFQRPQDDPAFPIGEEPCHTEGRRASDRGLLPLSVAEYLTLLDVVGRRDREGKASIRKEVPPLLERLGIDPESFAKAVCDFPKLFAGAAGPADALRDRAAELGRKTYKGVGAAQRVFRSPSNSD